MAHYGRSQHVEGRAVTTETTLRTVHELDDVKDSSARLGEPRQDLDAEVRLTLIAGFLIGFAIAGIFLVYVVLSEAKLLEWPAL